MLQALSGAGKDTVMKKIEVLTHSSIRIQCDAFTLYVDPFRLPDGAAPKDADFILVTHDHFDHFSPADIEKAAGKNAALIVPETMKEKAREAAALVKETMTVAPGQTYTFGPLSFTTVPAYNVGKLFHPKKNGWVGYLITVDGERVFIAGDTDVTPELKNLKCDVALLPIGGTYTMNYKEAAALVNEIQTKTVIPTHYGSVAGSEDDARRFASLVKPPVKVEIIKQY